ncbi:MAG: transposase [Granulosicoccaceae bacterium]
MPRRARLMLPGIAAHVIQRGNNRQACFYQSGDYRRYLSWLEEYSAEHECQIHAFCLMTNHVHLLLTGEKVESIALLMKHLGQRYTQYVNRRYNRSGTLWEGRYKSCLVWEASYLLACYRYIEMNPVRAGMVEHPAEYPWTSYRYNAQGDELNLITPHEHYLRLGLPRCKRTKNYRSLFHNCMPSEMMEQIRQSTRGNYALGSDVFVSKVETTLGCRAKRGKAGRPFSRVAEK